MSHKDQRFQQFLGLMLPVFGIAVLVGVYFIFSGSGSTGTAESNPADCDYTAQASGSTVQQISSQSPDGGCVQLSDLEGEVIMLNFWATWCPPCRAEMPTIQNAYETYSDQGFKVLAINNGEGAGTINSFLETHGLTFPVAMDQSSRISRTFGIRNFPTSVFIDEDGNVLAQHTGMISPTQLERYIQSGMNTG